MVTDCDLSQDPLVFIKECVQNRRIFWTYHVNMRLRMRGITRKAIIGSIDSYQLIEAYPDDKYLPSYLIWSEDESITIHILFAVDVEQRNVRVITAYHPDPDEWDNGLKRRRAK